MKIYFYAIGIFIALTWTSCQSSTFNSAYVLFTDPQPLDGRNSDSIPKALRNSYCNYSDESTLWITAKGIYKRLPQVEMIHRQNCDTTLQIVGDSLVIDQEGYRYVAQRLGDSLKVDVSRTDTLFEMGKDQCLKKQGKDYFFNKRTEQGWMLAKLNLKRGKLTMSTLGELDILSLKALGKSLSDTIPYIFELDKEHFYAFLKKGGFRYTDTLHAVK